ncbi:GLRX2 family protein [Megaselia abdita]
MGSTISRKAVDMSSPAAQFVKESIGSGRVVIFSKSSCPYCTMAKEQFKKLNFPTKVIELNQRNDGGEIQDVLGEMTGGRTVPRVFVDGNFIGGGTDVKQMYDNGKLKSLLGC